MIPRIGALYEPRSCRFEAAAKARSVNQVVRLRTKTTLRRPHRVPQRLRLQLRVGQESVGYFSGLQN